MASFICYTRESLEAIKGGSTALMTLLDQLCSHRSAILSILREEIQASLIPASNDNITQLKKKSLLCY